VKPRAVDWLVCPLCTSALEFEQLAEAAPSSDRSESSSCSRCHAPSTEEARTGAEGNCSACYGLEVNTGTLACKAGHTFPIEHGVPRLLLDRQSESPEARSIRESFSAQWADYHHEAGDKTWGQTLDQRIGDFLRMVDMRPEELRGQLVLDAGCGNGMLSHAITDFGCEVLAADLSESVVAAHRHFASQGNGPPHFVQADLMRPAFRRDAFDIVFCAGVLIVTPDSRRTFDEVIKAVAPGGRLFVWVYWREPGLKYRIKTGLRRVLSPLPLPVKRGVSAVFTAQALARGHLAHRLGREGADEPTRWREAYVVQHDFFTPRYRWEHTEDHGWYRDHGFTDIKTTEVVKAGFGVLARRPDVPQHVQREEAAAPVSAAATDGDR
jgi:2-polyprenyl-3-methyl-5-hydroxy-6-metoxy-1,4-benzoquinol methylase